MSTNLSIDNIPLSPGMARVLLRFNEVDEIPIEEMDPRLPSGLEDKGLAVVGAITVRVSPRGRKIAKELLARGYEPPEPKRITKRVASITPLKTRPPADGLRNRATAPNVPDRAAVAPSSPRGTDQPPPPAPAASVPVPYGDPFAPVDHDIDAALGRLNPTTRRVLGHVRAQIVARYTQDLDAVDRLITIAATIEADRPSAPAV